MGFLLAMVSSVSARLALFLLWLFTNRVDRAFDGWVLPVLGLIVAPWTTLMYSLAWGPAHELNGGRWLIVVFGVGLDVLTYLSGARSRRR